MLLALSKQKLKKCSAVKVARVGQQSDIGKEVSMVTKAEKEVNSC